jgi:hypothetical protein
MIYLSLDKDGLKLLYLKRSFMGQYEVSTFEKKHSTDLLQEGKVLNVDVVASAIKEGINSVVGTNQNGKEIYLVLPQAQQVHFIMMQKRVVESRQLHYQKAKHLRVFGITMKNLEHIRLACQIMVHLLMGQQVW